MNAPLDIVVERALGTSTSLATLVSTRVAKRILPTTFANTQAALCIHEEAVKSELASPTMTAIYTFKSYGGTDDPDDADAVGRAVYDRFHNITADATTGGIVRSTLVSGQLTVDPDTGWPVHISRYEIITR